MRKTSATKWKSLRLTARNTAAHSEVTDNGFTVEIRTRVRREGEKRPVEVTEEKLFAYADARSVKYIFEF